MARKRISEFRAKTLLYKQLDLLYNGTQVTDQQPLINSFNNQKKYVVKVDSGVKGRYKKGLVILNQEARHILDAIQLLKDKGYSQFLIEEMQLYSKEDERYISIERLREGYKILFSKSGGIDIEQNQSLIKEIQIPYDSLEDTIKSIPALNGDFLRNLLTAFDDYHFSFLEINPFIFHNSQFIILDAAVEVDSTAEFFVNNAWTEKDFTDFGNAKKTDEEINIKYLASKSQAAFSLEVLAPNGSIFMILSGGGASIVLADEVSNLDYGKLLANYGEFSGNPSAEESYLYTKNVLKLLLKSSADKKVLIIAGGVANFTDVRITFNGLIKALTEMSGYLQKQKIKVFVRRGGPHQNEGLEAMRAFLEKEQLLGVVAGPEMVLTNIVTEAITELKVK